MRDDSSAAERFLGHRHAKHGLEIEERQHAHEQSTDFCRDRPGRGARISATCTSESSHAGMVPTAPRAISSVM
jgi:hypothetical protein